MLTPKTKYKVVGGGWNVYDQIVSPGDMIGDTRPDLLAKTPAGDLYLYEGYGTEGKFKAKVKLTGGFKGYLLVGGHKMGKGGVGALLARDPSGKLFRYDALGKGKPAPRVMIGTGGWNTYTAIVGVSDLHGDFYQGELVARDKAGRLWRYDGKSDGTLSSPVDIGGGWNTYKSLY